MSCLRRITSSAIFVSLRALRTSSRFSSTARPELDFDYLLDNRNLEAIKKNISHRKGVGDVNQLHTTWNEIEKIMTEKDKPSLTEEDVRALWDKLYDLALAIPNETHPETPEGMTEKVLTEWGEKLEAPELLTAEKIVQSWRSLLHPTDSCGQRSYTMLGSLANLERALLEYVLERITVLGFKPVTVPDLVSTEVTEACGLSRRSNQHIQYVLSNENNIALSGTAEMGIAALLRDRTFEAEQLPVRLVAVSRCFRPEISKSATEAKLYRVHEFSKVEMFSICEPEQSNQELEYIVDIQKGTFQSLGLHCRLIEMPSEELGAPAYRKKDIECWMPGRKLYGEVSSASNCTDFQARRLGIRYKTKDGQIKFAHTCNGTAIASTRALISLLETFQTENKGLLELPNVIRRRLKTQRPLPLRFKLAPALC